jgi:hypothetical protein
MKIRSTKWNKTVASRFLLGLLGSAPILLLSSIAQAGATPNRQMPAKAIQKLSIQSVDRAILARQELSPYPDALSRVKQPDGDRKTAGMIRVPSQVFLER